MTSRFLFIDLELLRNCERNWFRLSHSTAGSHCVDIVGSGLGALVALNVRTEVPLPGAAKLAFEKEAVTPVGKPVELSAIAELKAPESWLDKLS